MLIHTFLQNFILSIIYEIICSAIWFLFFPEKEKKKKKIPLLAAREVDQNAAWMLFFPKVVVLVESL